MCIYPHNYNNNHNQSKSLGRKSFLLLPLFFQTTLAILIGLCCQSCSHLDLEREKVNLDLSSPEKNFMVFKEGLKRDETLFHSFLCLSTEMQKRYPYFSRFYPFFTRSEEGILLRKVLIVATLQNQKRYSDNLTILTIKYNKYVIEVPYKCSSVSYIDEETGEEYEKVEWKVDLDIQDYIDQLTEWYNNLTKEEKREIDKIEYERAKVWNLHRRRM